MQIFAAPFGMRIGLLGASGKMGIAVHEASLNYPDIKLMLYSRSANPGPESSYFADKKSLFENSEVVIDFSVSTQGLENYKYAQDYMKPLLIATTGHQNLEEFKNTRVPILYSPNTCIEWLIIKRCINRICDGNPEFVVKIDDIHAITKVDAPSGTVKDLAQSLDNPIITSIRKTAVASWHKVGLYGTQQSIHLEHQVLNRSVYANGALVLARLLLNKPPKLYSTEELYFSD